MDIREIKKYLRGDMKPDEIRRFKDWLGSQESNEQLSDLLNSIDENEVINDGSAIENRLWGKINNRLDIEEIIMSISKEHKKQQERLDKSRKPVKSQFAAKRKSYTNIVLIVILLVASVSALVLNNLMSFEQKPEVASVDLIEKSAEKGQKLTLHLSDGTKVMLNSNSSIKFPRSFEGNTRDVSVEGEVFFDVAHDESKPFIVHAGEVSAKVLGTTFNFQYWPEKNFNRISLVTGKVQVNLENQNEKADNRGEYILTPGEEIKIDNAKGKVQKGNFDIEGVTAWKNGAIYFKYSGLDEVVKTLENWYGVDIEVQGHPAQAWKLTAKFSNENLENVLQSLSHSQGIKYEIKGKSVTIKF